MGTDSSGQEADTGQIAFCSICGASLSDPEFALNYPNFVCEGCNQDAVNKDGETPWHGWPPGKEPESESGVIQMAPDQGENPVYIEGIKCWRRYRFGGHIAFRDIFDCETLAEFYDRHEKEDGYFQAYNSPNPPGADTDRDRIVVNTVDKDKLETLIWGILSADTGEILSRNVQAERAVGPFEDFLDLAKGHAGGEEHYREVVTDPTWLLSVFDSYGAQAEKPKVQYLVPELDRALTGNSGIVETGALRGLRQQNASQEVFELSFRPKDRCNALNEVSREEPPSQMTLGDIGGADDASGSDESTLTVRYRLPYQGGSKKLIDLGLETASSVLSEIEKAVAGTDYLFASSLPAVDIHAYSSQREVLTIAIDASTVQEVDWQEQLDQPKQLTELAVTIETGL